MNYIAKFQSHISHIQMPHRVKAVGMSHVSLGSRNYNTMMCVTMMPCTTISVGV